MQKEIAQNAIYYYLRAQEVGRNFNASLVEQHLEELPNEKTYAIETIKGYRRVLRTLFNEAVRYEWIVKNPVCSTKIGAGSSNTSLRSVPEKEVFSFAEAREFIARLNELPPEPNNITA